MLLNKFTPSKYWLKRLDTTFSVTTNQNSIKVSKEMRLQNFGYKCYLRSNENIKECYLNRKSNQSENFFLEYKTTFSLINKQESFQRRLEFILVGLM